MGSPPHKPFPSTRTEWLERPFNLKVIFRSFMFISASAFTRLTLRWTSIFATIWASFRVPAMYLFVWFSVSFSLTPRSGNLTYWHFHPSGFCLRAFLSGFFIIARRFTREPESFFSSLLISFHCQIQISFRAVCCMSFLHICLCPGAGVARWIANRTDWYWRLLVFLKDCMSISCHCSAA